MLNDTTLREHGECWMIQHEESMENVEWFNTKRAWIMLNDTKLREHGECLMIQH
jgi:hypothetical protein